MSQAGQVTDLFLTLAKQRVRSNVGRLFLPFSLGKAPVVENRGNQTAEPIL